MQERFLEGRTALVTGSVQGIGFAIGKALASAGAPFEQCTRPELPILVFDVDMPAFGRHYCYDGRA